MCDIKEPDKISDAEDFINAMSYIIESINNSSSINRVIQKRVYRIKEEDVDELINNSEYKEGSK